jgi:hypothetical protein
MRYLELTLGLVVVWCAAARAEPTMLTMQLPGLMCRPAITAAERAGAIPPQLMAAIGRVESGRLDPASGRMQPWPWTINAEGQGSYYDTKAQAIAAVRALQARGVRSIDVGCMQVNLMHHPTAFANLEEAFDPTTNATYAARLLNELHAQGGDWPHAAALYHSATPDLAAAYRRSVMAIWPEERRLAGGNPLLAQAGPGQLGGIPPTAGGPLRVGISATLPHASAQSGRTLAAYRAAPILFANRSPGRVGG